MGKYFEGLDMACREELIKRLRRDDFGDGQNGGFTTEEKEIILETWAARTTVILNGFDAVDEVAFHDLQTVEMRIFAARSRRDGRIKSAPIPISLKLLFLILIFTGLVMISLGVWLFFA